MIKRGFLFFISFFMVTCWYAGAQIQKGRALFEHLTLEDGLSSNGVNCIFQDSRGFIWIGTNSGLNRYDGVDIVQYYHEETRNSVAGNVITSIREDKKQNLWIGTNHGVSFFEPGKNRFTNYLNTPDEVEKLKSGYYYVGMDADNNLWATSNFHLSLFDKESKQFTHVKVDNGENLAVTRNYMIRSVFEDSQKRLWLPTSYGVKLFNRSSNQFTSFIYPEKDKAAPENFVVSIRETAGHKIIAATWGGSILIYNEQKKVFDKLTLFEEPVPGGSFINIILDVLPVQGKLYCATSQGLVVIDESDVVPGICKKFIQYTHSDTDQKSINSNILTSLLLDKAGTLWITAKGVSKIDPLKQQFKTSFLYENNQPVNINTAAVRNNRLLLGAHEAFFFDNERLSPLALAPKLKSSFGTSIWDMHAGRNFNWLATTNGLIQLDQDGKYIRQYTHQPGNPGSLAAERLWKVYEDSRGLVWTGTVRRGIGIVNPVSGTVKNYFSDKEAPHSLFNKYISSFYEDKESNIWFTSGGGWLYCYHRLEDSFSVTRLKLKNGKEVLSEPVILEKTDQGSLILASTQGLLQFDLQTQEFNVIAFDVNMSNVSGAIMDRKGHYWIITGNGLLNYNVNLKVFKRYTIQTGLPTNEDINEIELMPDDRILLTGMGFVCLFNPQELGNNRNIPPVHITKVLANSKDSLHNKTNISLPHLSGIEFHFAALGFSTASQNMYKYRLTGIDNNWSLPTTQRSVSYAQLPPGSYTFEVMGSNADGLWNETPALFTFSITRPFYKTWWFYTLLIALLIGISYTFYRYRLRKAVELEKMRTRIATDLHDDIGATLSSISMYSDALKKQVKESLPHLEPVLTKMGESSREMVTGMSDIVWAINPDNDSGEKLISRMDSYASDMCAVKNIQLRFIYDEKIKQLVLPLEIRKNVYLIFKEAVNNAVKYAEARHITIQLRYNEQLFLAVKDDGRGFEEPMVRKGNGLKNFGIRAAEIKGSVTIHSSPGHGTEIILTCTV